MAGCQTPLPPVPHPSAPTKIARIRILTDVDDDVELCAEPTASMLFREPNLRGPVCGITVGELRAWLQRVSRAD